MYLLTIVLGRQYQLQGKKPSQSAQLSGAVIVTINCELNFQFNFLRQLTITPPPILIYLNLRARILVIIAFRFVLKVPRCVSLQFHSLHL